MIRSLSASAGAAALALLAGMADAAVLLPTSLTASTSGGAAADGTRTYTDDLYLDTLSFSDGVGGSVVYDGTAGGFAAARQITVLSGRGKFNAEWGDDDDATDGDGNPLDKAGFPTAEQETDDPGIQDHALLAAVNSRSISEMWDGESAGTGSVLVEFSKTLAFDAVGGDGLADIVFIERGGNDVFTVELLLGGTAAAPIYSSGVTMDSGDFWASGLDINTVEIAGAQQLFIGGFDFADFGLGAGDVVSGFRLTSSDGPDMGGFFLVAADPGDFGGPPPPIVTMAAVPLPAPIVMLLTALGGLGLARRRKPLAVGGEGLEPPTSSV